MEDKILVDFNKNPRAKEAMLKFIQALEGERSENNGEGRYDTKAKAVL